MQTQEKYNCSVRILSQTEQRKSIFNVKGNVTLSPSGATLCYKQENSSVTLTLEGKNAVYMQREGDCFLSLVFFSGKLSEGEIGISAQEKGKVDIYTDKAEVFYGENGKTIKITLDYVLKFSPEEKQRTALQIIIEQKN